MSWRVRALVAVLAAAGTVPALVPHPALAQRNGDVSNGLDNQPTQGEVRSREKAAGVASPGAQQRQQTDAVDDIYKQLMSKEHPQDRPPGPILPNGAPPTSR